MKKRELIILLILNFFLISFTLSQESIPSSMPQIPGVLGEFNPETGQPKNLETFQKYGDALVEREQNKTYLLKEWTNILAKNKFLGPVLFYTDKFLSFFDFLWIYSFGSGFSWSLKFFIHFFIWFIITWIIFLSLKDADIFNPIFAFITGAIVASITGSFGIITIFFNFINTMITDLLGLTFLVIIIIFLLALYGMILHRFKGESEQEKLKRADERRLAAGDVADKFLEIGKKK